ncbi:MAG: GNAT family N-acetyltransferase [Betaproteobacteria bacterium]
MQLGRERAIRPPAPALFVRPIVPADEEALLQFIRRLSAASRYARFMAAVRELPGHMLDRLLHPAPGREAVLVANSPLDGIVGLAQYVADESGESCEVALVISDAWQHQGLGTEMLNALVNVASDNAIGYFHADVLADNYPMRALARKVGCDVRVSRDASFVVQISRSIRAPAQTASAGLWQ